ncbi:DUF4190 domain-containing protein [Pseudogracilibacillus auburnensis]|uniref:DUF4190 domain-containing protein n=1 Tax=Pseudogracilibacillus auburnensis TaxID=1494959 RepID=UPI0027DA8FB9|nr:DUF4190 domain-containing protein [Pseudogracilibacillus auburnensis]
MLKTNNHSIVALTLGILSLFIPIIGIILGILGVIKAKKSLSEIEHSNESGKGYAISGRICSIVGICLQGVWLLLVIIGIMSYYVVDLQ